MVKQITFCTQEQIAQDYQQAIVIGYEENLKNGIQVLSLPDKAFKLCQALRKSMESKKTAEIRTFYDSETSHKLRKFSIIQLPGVLSRHLAPANYHLLKSVLTDKLVTEEKCVIVIAVKDPAHVLGFAVQLAKAFPNFSRKTNAHSKDVSIQCVFCSPKPLTAADFRQLDALVSSVRLCAELVDKPTNELNTREFASVLCKEAKDLDLKIQFLKGKVLLDQGFGGIYNVGKASDSKPMLCVMSYVPEKSMRTVALVGKGITFDTGGLSLKPHEHIVGMKSDMAGAAAILGALRAAALVKLPCTIHAVFCLAENAIGPEALRPDDIISLYSGKTVEINNTDAEGRLLLADGVAYASKVLKPELIVDMATLTGAQMICTGMLHAAVLTQSEKLETLVQTVGKTTGELVYPILYAPELLMKEFASEVADFKNSCKSRLNASSSCAGHFVEANLDEKYEGDWLHIDIAGPAWDADRAQGYGVALLFVLLIAYQGK